MAHAHTGMITDIPNPRTPINTHIGLHHRHTCKNTDVHNRKQTQAHTSIHKLIRVHIHKYAYTDMRSQLQVRNYTR